ncbi:hypothetical protein BDZ94DRAFT_1369154 [Collybia nuda]|uniref:Uncharacterized protein n=1 Tax=Collybia nuda TaxID=64659 RepID=A0A9P5XR45_9AGAR|nr:hypothetical protein BDZ94DRAFT_1369154 [Collybia nuda]
MQARAPTIKTNKKTSTPEIHPPSTTIPPPSNITRPKKRELLPLTPHRTGAPIKRHASDSIVPRFSEDPFTAQPHVPTSIKYTLNPVPPLKSPQNLPKQLPTTTNDKNQNSRMDAPMEDPPSPSPQTPNLTTEPQNTDPTTQEAHSTNPHPNTHQTDSSNPDDHTTSTPTNEPSKNDPSATDALVAINGVVTNTNGLRRTAIPGDGFPVPQLGDSVWRNIPPTMKANWTAKPGPKAWARLYRAYYTEDMSSQAQDIKKLIERFTNAPDVLVSTPIAENRPSPASGPPHHFLISGLSQHAHDRLINTRVIATETTIILTIPFIQPLPEYIGTLENFSLGESEHDKKIVANTVKSALETNPGITAFVNDHLPRTNPRTTLPTPTSIRIETLRIRTSKTTNKVVWNIYCVNPPPLPFNKYIQWAKMIKGLNFPTEDFGAGRMRSTDHRGINKQFHCAGCKSCDHPTGLCPLPDIQGWLGPAHATEDLSLYDQHTTHTESNRGRGRGQSRGGRGRSRGTRSRGRF